MKSVFGLNDNPMPTSTASSAVAPSMKRQRNMSERLLFTSMRRRAVILTYRILIQMRTSNATEFDRTLPVMSYMLSLSTSHFEKKNTTPSLMMKIPPAVRRIHFRDDDDRDLTSLLAVAGRGSLANATIAHPRISVVMAVDRAWTANGELMNVSRMFAPSVPIRNPMMFPTMMIAAVNSMLRFLLKHTSRAMVMVRRVSRSSSPTP